MEHPLVSYLVRARHATPYGQRVWPDGRAEAYRTSRRVRDESGSYHTEQLPPDWYPLTTLSVPQLDAIKDALEAANVYKMPKNIDTVDPTVSDSASAEWQVSTSDGLKTITVAQWGPLADAARPLMDVLNRMAEIINFALTGSPDVP